MKKYSSVLSASKGSIFSTCKLIGAFQLSKYLLKERLLILCFHGFQLMDEARFRPQLFMRDTTFLRRLETIRRSGFNVLKLGDALARLKNGGLSGNTLCITIDDGFVSTLKVAAPLLKSFGYPATLYLTSYYSMKEAPIFRLVVQYMFWKTLVKELGVSKEPWSPDSDVSLMEQDTKDKLCWNIISYGESRESDADREDICQSLGTQLQIDYGELCRSRVLNILSAQELKQLNEFGIDIQLHTHRHRFPLDNEAWARKEIRENRDYISRITGNTPEHFCYPSGIWNVSQWKWLEEEHVISAVTCESGFNQAATPPYSLYRILDQDDLPDIEFEAALNGWSELLQMSLGKRFRANKRRRLGN